MVIFELDSGCGLQTILYKKQQELTAQLELQAKAEALLGQTLNYQVQADDPLKICGSG